MTDYAMEDVDCDNEGSVVIKDVDLGIAVEDVDFDDEGNAAITYDKRVIAVKFCRTSGAEAAWAGPRDAGSSRKRRRSSIPPSASTASTATSM